jgi:hypothetical protein
LSEVEKIFVKFEASEAGLESQRPESGALRAVPEPVLAFRFRVRLADGLDLVDVVFRARVAAVARPRKRIALLLLLLLLRRRLLLLLWNGRVVDQALKIYETRLVIKLISHK